ncbi:MAG: hypothetical protein U0441_01860 [Polyangiaceae bacterium]
MARSLIALAALASIPLFAGCSTGAPGEVKLGVDVAAITVSATQTSTNSSSSDDLVLERVRILVETAKVGYHNDQKTGGESAEAGPIVIDLTADEIANGAHREISVGSLPSGTYGGAEIEIAPLKSDDDTSAAELADFVSSGASVIVDGTYMGASFQFAGHFLAEQGTDGDVDIDAATPIALAFTVDASTWFKDSSGALLDPSDAAQHDAMAVAICETLDTEAADAGGGMGKGDGDCPDGGAGAGPHGDGPMAGGAPPAGSGGAPAGGPDGDGDGPMAGGAPPAGSGGAPAGGAPPAGHKGGKGGKGGGQQHCVEASN